MKQFLYVFAKEASVTFSIAQKTRCATHKYA